MLDQEPGQKPVVEPVVEPVVAPTGEPAADPVVVPVVKPDAYDVTVDGKQVRMTIDELKENAVKVAGADAKFRAASEMKKQADKGVKVMELFTSLSGNPSPSPEDVSELATLLGADPVEFTKAMYGKEQKMPTEKEVEQTSQHTQTQPLSVGTEQLSQDVQAQLKWSREQQVKEAGKEINEKIENFIDKDEILGKLISDTDDEQRADVRSAIKDIVHESVRGKILATGQFGADTVKEAGQHARAVLKRIGIPSKVYKQLNLAVLGLGPSGQIPAEVQADEPIKRVGMAEDSYVSNAVKRVQQAMLKTLRK